MVVLLVMLLMLLLLILMLLMHGLIKMHCHNIFHWTYPWNI
jgi:Ni/Fe-hydrogenase subunit HybB-like protein